MGDRHSEWSVHPLLASAKILKYRNVVRSSRDIDHILSYDVFYYNYSYPDQFRLEGHHQCRSNKDNVQHPTLKISMDFTL